VLVQQLTEQESGRAGADDGDLGTHETGLFSCFETGPNSKCGLSLIVHHELTSL
jgi:hypothetical protein